MDGKSLSMLFMLVVAWFVLNRWVLPFFGVNTCMSCSTSCQPPSRPTVIYSADRSETPAESDEDQTLRSAPSKPETIQNLP